MLLTAYRLPYVVHHTPIPFMREGKDCSVRVSFVGPATDAAVTDAESLLTAFLHLAQSGALSGAAIEPWISGIDTYDRISQAKETVTWKLTGVRVDDRSATILAQLFLLTHANHPIRQMAIYDASHGDRLVPIAATNEDNDVYPEIYAAWRSRVIISPSLSEDPIISATFSSVISNSNRDDIQTNINNCIAAMAVGCYPISPLQPDECGLEYDRDIDFFNTDLEFGLASFRCHKNSLAGLCNSLFSIRESLEVLAIVIK